MRLSIRLIAAIATLTIITVLVLFASPLLLVLLDNFMVLDWSRLSSIGQSYTGVSALLSAGTLIAVAVTVQQQSKQTRLARQQATKIMQFELLRLALNEPGTYGPVVGYWESGEGDRNCRQHLFTTMWMWYVSFAYETGEEPETRCTQNILLLLSQVKKGVGGAQSLFPAGSRLLASVHACKNLYRS